MDSLKGREGSTELILRDGVPYDLTGYKQVVRIQDFPLTEYKIGSQSKIMDITITDDTNYLTDVEFWAYFCRTNAADQYVALSANEQGILYETGGLIDSIEIFADS